MSEIRNLDRLRRWKARFRLSPSVLLGKIKNTADVRIVKESNDPNARASVLEIVTPELAYEDARNYALEVANRVADYLSFLKQSSVGATLFNINQIPPRGSKIRIKVPFATRRLVDRPTNIDMSAKPIAQITGEQEAQLARQLSHYRRALETDDVITRVREAYQVIEEDEITYRQFLDNYRYVRHLVSHPKLSKSCAVYQAKKRFGKSYINPSSPEDLAKLCEDAKNLMEKAKEILLKVFPIYEQS
jgi:hypothetical protein